MVHSRNLVISALALLLITFFGVGRMLFWETAGSTPAFVATVSLSEPARDFAGTATVPASDPDRDAYVASLRATLANQVGESVVVPPTPDVTTVADARAELAAEAPPETEVAIKWCDATVLETKFLAQWPQAKISVVTNEGARAIVAFPSSEVVDSAAETLPPQTLMQFALVPPVRSEPACLTHAYIGVTIDGRLIHNNDVVLYAGLSADTLIGYAFDGQPIYGTSDEVTDECGGVSGSEYRYHVNAERAFIIGCFVSEPQQLPLVG